jgi:hypothetical protein
MQGRRPVSNIWREGPMEVILWIFLGIIVLVVVVAIGAAMQGTEQRKRAAEAVERITEQYKVTDTYVSPFDSSCVALNWDDRVLVAGSGGPERQYPFDCLYQVDIDIDGNTVTLTSGTTKTRRGSQLAGAAAGGIVFGPLGLLVGGFTGGNKTNSQVVDKRYVRSLALVLYLRDRRDPVQRVTFFRFDAGQGLDASNEFVKNAAKQAERYATLLSQIMEETAPREAEPEARDVSAELERLWGLKLTGALTDQEYRDQKARLLR